MFLYILNTVYFVAGVIDQDYRGNVGVVLFNHADQDFEGKLQNSFKKYFFLFIKKINFGSTELNTQVRFSVQNKADICSQFYLL